MSCGKRLVTVVVQHGGVDGKDLPSPEMDVVTSRLSYKWAFGRIEQGTAAKEAVNLGIKSGKAVPAPRHFHTKLRRHAEERPEGHPYLTGTGKLHMHRMQRCCQRD